MRDFEEIKGLTEFYELIGALFGDGHIKYFQEKYCYYGITISGNLTEDLDYLIYLQRLIQSITELNPSLNKRKKYHVAYLNLNNKKLLDFLVKTCKLPYNQNKRKSHVPQIISRCNNNPQLSSFVRGLTDTDGTLIFGKKGCYKRYEYPVIEIKNSNLLLLEDTKKILKKIGFAPKIRKSGLNDYCLYISGKKNLEKWIQEIGFSNPKHKTKYLIWKRFGEGLPKTTIKERYLLLHNNNLRQCGVGREAMHST